MYRAGGRCRTGSVIATIHHAWNSSSQCISLFSMIDLVRAEVPPILITCEKIEQLKMNTFTTDRRNGTVFTHIMSAIVPVYTWGDVQMCHVAHDIEMSHISFDN